MEHTLPADLEALINKRIATGAFRNAEQVFRHALETQDALETWEDDEKCALAAQAEAGFLQSERGELTDGCVARAELQEMNAQWLSLRC